MIFTVCFQTFVVTSMFLQRVINESSLKEQWKINVPEFNEAKTIQIKKVCIEFIKVSNMSHQWIINESSTKQLWNLKVSENTSIKPIRIINACIEVFAVTSMLLQRFINESSMKKQWNINDPDVNTTKTKKDLKSFHRKYQGFKYVSPKNRQRIIDEASRKHECFGD